MRDSPSDHLCRLAPGGRVFVGAQVFYRFSQAPVGTGRMRYQISLGHGTAIPRYRADRVRKSRKRAEAGEYVFT